MRILLDHCVPVRLRRLLPGHEIRTAAEMGWNRLRNGKLLAEAAAQFDVMLTVDRNIRHQQDLARLPIAIVVIVAQSNTLADLAPLVPAVEEALKHLAPRALIEISRP